MATSKTKRMAAVTALSAALLMGGVAAAQADGPACTHGKGKGEGTGAPGKGKGKGAALGWPHGCKDKDRSDDDKPEQDDSGSDDETGGGAENPGGEVNGGNPTVDVDVDVNVDADLPELPDPAQIAEDTVQDVVSIITPAAMNAVGQTLETAETATDLVGNDVSAIAGLLDSAIAAATDLEVGSAGAGINVSRDGASGTVTVSGATSGITSLGGQLLDGAFGIATGTTGAVTSLVAGMSLPL